MELKDRRISTLKRVSGVGIGGATLVFLCMMILGYGSFGSHTQAFLLDNYHSTDVMANVARLLTGLAIIAGYPLVFAGLKAAMFSLTRLSRPTVEGKERKQNRISTITLACISIAACFITEYRLTTVIGIFGSIFGSSILCVLPGIVNNSLLRVADSKGQQLTDSFFKGEMLFNKILVAFGIIYAVLGTWISLKEARLF